MKGCVNDVSECRNNGRRNGLKEMRWNRIKRTSSRMTGENEIRLEYCVNCVLVGVLLDIRLKQ